MWTDTPLSLQTCWSSGAPWLPVPAAPKPLLPDPSSLTPDHSQPACPHPLWSPGPLSKRRVLPPLSPPTRIFFQDQETLVWAKAVGVGAASCHACLLAPRSPVNPVKYKSWGLAGTSKLGQGPLFLLEAEGYLPWSCRGVKASRCILSLSKQI